ncbi:hypothetical protein C4N9_20920 [Pararhodobacter marinus]|uniref:Uncharacterized protein n=1 Tax=Pararhodobacter marinus TaxID=2184063 RepID=A0A2U2C4J1_9RHOB|nr:hypothetical protein [Pararhodobacter marinus]PWE26724.1 hypothetical protein C4N9_20920 [Pararhodobacter marinus]
MAFKWKERQAIIDGYLAETGRNQFHPAEFIDWLGGKPDHEAYPWFFGTDDATAAREHRISLARRMASGLRLTVKVEETKYTVASVAVREFPAYVSPVAGRKAGGGYEPFDPKDKAAMAELRRQGVVALQSWLRRYAGAFADVDLSAIEEIAAEDSRVALSA